MQSIHLSDIEKALAAKPSAVAWAMYLDALRVFAPFWKEAVTHMAELTELPASKTAKYHEAADGAFTKLDDWYFERTPVVKARRDEIDAAISFIRNTALYNNVAVMPGAAAARHLASALRNGMHMATRGYKPEYFPHLMASGIASLAAAKSLFPLDFSDAVAQFTQPGESPSDYIDDIQAAVQRAATHSGLEAAFEQYQTALGELWRDFEHLKSWSAPDAVWRAQSESILAKTHQQSIREFHARGKDASDQNR